jgi:hypothetical protein
MPRTRTREHWDQVCRTRLETEVSWYQPRPERSLAPIRSEAPSLNASILDMGGGASHLVDKLLSLGYFEVTILDVSQAALNRSKERSDGWLIEFPGSRWILRAGHHPDLRTYGTTAPYLTS